jgi:NUMOD3 motif
MAAGKRLSHEEAANRFASAGYVLKSQYFRQSSKVDVWCQKHNQSYSVYPSNIFKGQRLWCCGNEARSELHTGKVISPETRAKLSTYAGVKHHFFGKTRGENDRRKVSNGIKSIAAASVDYAILKSSTGKTAGKKGRFYIALAGNGLIKLGSIVRTPLSARMSQIRGETGGVSLLLVAEVDDAGNYESAMLNRCRAHWAHGEFFYPTLLSSICETK